LGSVSRGCSKEKGPSDTAGYWSQEDRRPHDRADGSLVKKSLWIENGVTAPRVSPLKRKVHASEVQNQIRVAYLDYSIDVCDFTDVVRNGG